MDKKIQLPTINQIKKDIITVIYKGKKVRIDLTRELNIDANLINTQMKQLPSNYAFLSLLRDDYIYKRDKLQKEVDKAYHDAWVYYKEAGSMSNDYTDHKAATHPKYIQLLDRLQKVTYKTNRLISACKAYESREKIIQSFNANLRKQK